MQRQAIFFPLQIESDSNTPHRTSPAGLYGVPHSLPQKITPALTVRAVAIALPSAQTAPTVRPGLRAGVSCCHAFCFGFVIRHGSLSVLHPASFNRHSLHFITFHSLSITHARYIWAIIMCTFLAHGHKLHSLPSRGSFHFIPFRSFLFHSASCSPHAAIVVLACAVVRAAACHAFCIHTLLADTRPAPFNNLTRSKKITPGLVRSVHHHSRKSTLLHFTHSSHRASFRSSTSRSLLSPYLLLADSLRGGHFVRLSGSLTLPSRIQCQL